MKKRLVSSGFPGPTTSSHQPGLPVIGCSVAAILVQCAIGTIGDGERSQFDSAIELQLDVSAKLNPVSGKGGVGQARQVLRPVQAWSRGLGNRSTLTSSPGRVTFGPKTYSVNVFFDFSYATL